LKENLKLHNKILSLQNTCTNEKQLQLVKENSDLERKVQNLQADLEKMKGHFEDYQKIICR